MVADHIPHSQSVSDTRSPAYAEVADGVIGSTGVFNFRSDTVKAADDTQKPPPESEYTEMKNVYHEIPDVYQHWKCPILFTKDYRQLMRNREIRRLMDQSNSSSASNKEAGNSNTTYVTFDGSGRNRLSSRDMSASQRSDSDSSLALMDIEVYESFQSAHV